tara:strand:+ start:140 stop:1198 length:1059 start_codon:yes stop_codon:yes gene_type:complete
MCVKDACEENVTHTKYGGYCRKHKNEYLLYDGFIVYDRFTNKSSDYLKKDIINTLNILYKGKGWEKINKVYLFNNLKENFIEKNVSDCIVFTRNFLTEENIIFLKKLQREYNGRKINFLKGDGYKDKNKCNNDMDFFTYDSISDIDDKYFFSYTDTGGFIWFFDIRSFNKLMEMGQNNPYTREEIPKEVKERAINLSKILNLTDEDELINDEELILTRNQILKQKTIDIFSQMEQFGYGCNISWFLDLDSRGLKKLYKNLEDIWNYRLNLSYETKSRISPPNGIAFNISFNEVNHMTNIIELQELILNEVFKFNNAITEGDRKLGLMYFLLGLGLVSRECYEAHQWIIHALY